MHPCPHLQTGLTALVITQTITARLNPSSILISIDKRCPHAVLSRSFEEIRAEPKKVIVMAKCQVTGKQRMVGNKVSHANNHNKKVFKANIQTKRFYIPEEDRWVRLKVSTRAIRSLTRHGVLNFAKKNGLKL